MRPFLFLSTFLSVATAGQVGIVNGEVAQAGEFPSVVSVGYTGRPEWEHLCGGVIIAPTYVITGGHCLPPGRPRNYGIKAGTTNIETGGQIARVTNVQRHPQFQRDPLLFDLAVLTVNPPIVMGPLVSVASIPTNIDKLLKRGGPLQFAGWGNLEQPGEWTYVLHKMKSRYLVYDRTLCKQQFPRGFVRDFHLCAQGKSSTCQGDSGGPLLVAYQGQTYTIATQSFSDNRCQPAAPDVYTLNPDFCQFFADATQVQNICVTPP